MCPDGQVAPHIALAGTDVNRQLASHSSSLHCKLSRFESAGLVCFLKP